jgi:hypothetical protein
MSEAFLRIIGKLVSFAAVNRDPFHIDPPLDRSIHSELPRLARVGQAERLRQDRALPQVTLNPVARSIKSALCKSASSTQMGE